MLDKALNLILKKAADSHEQGKWPERCLFWFRRTQQQLFAHF
ncbi:hypothetical protein [Paenibacillus algorifonticola]|nr:hypothetical protein [Paenibacillus algorifonticola]